MKRDFFCGGPGVIKQVSKRQKRPQIDIALVFMVIENRGYQRLPQVPSMNSLIYEKVKRFYVDTRKHRANS